MLTQSLTVIFMAACQGIEPWPSDSESDVLPLDQPATCVAGDTGIEPVTRGPKPRVMNRFTNPLQSLG